MKPISVVLAHFVCWACACDTVKALARFDTLNCLQQKVLRQRLYPQQGLKKDVSCDLGLHGKDQSGSGLT